MSAWRRWLRRPGTAVTIGLVAAVVALLLPTGAAADFLDPRDHGRTGAAALVELASIHRQVDIALEPQGDTSTAVVLVDAMTLEQRQTLLEWVLGGGWLVVLDPSSELSAPRTEAPGRVSVLTPVTLEPACEPGESGMVDEPVGAFSWTTLATEQADASCFPLQEGAALVVHPVGAGRLLSFGAPGALTNQHIGREGHPSLAAALVTWGPPGDLLVVDRPPPGSGPSTAIDLVPSRAWQALTLVGLAWLLAMIAAGRRHGLPVAERVPVTVRGADLTRSVGSLLARTADRDHAAATVRGGVRDALGRRLPAAPRGEWKPADVARIAAHLGLPPEILARAVTDGPVAADHELVDVARAAANVHARLHPGTDPPSAGADPRNPGTDSRNPGTGTSDRPGSGPR